jgi:hypothetical protein
VICACHQINVPHTIAFQVIHQGCEIGEGVFRSVIEHNPALVHPRIPYEPLRELGIAASTHDQGELQLLRQAQPYPFAIEISTQHENALRRLNRGEDLTERL